VLVPCFSAPNNWSRERAECEFRWTEAAQIEELFAVPPQPKFVHLAADDGRTRAEDRRERGVHHRLCDANICCLPAMHYAHHVATSTVSSFQFPLVLLRRRSSFYMFAARAYPVSLFRTTSFLPSLHTVSLFLSFKLQYFWLACFYTKFLPTTLQCTVFSIDANVNRLVSLQLRFDFEPTAVRPRNDHSTTYKTI